jgi:glycosyltransferase involved in cell wall biosynthesis
VGNDTAAGCAKKICESVDYIWTPSSWGRQNLINNGFKPEKVSIVPQGVDSDFFTPGVKKSGNFRFLMVGKWEERKFQNGLVKAFAAEFHPGEGVELILHAHNPYIPGFSMKKKLEELGNPDDVSDKGRIAHGDAQRFSWRHSARTAYRTIVTHLGET